MVDEKKYPSLWRKGDPSGGTTLLSGASGRGGGGVHDGPRSGGSARTALPPARQALGRADLSPAGRDGRRRARRRPGGPRLLPRPEGGRGRLRLGGRAGLG